MSRKILNSDGEIVDASSEDEAQFDQDVIDAGNRVEQLTFATVANAQLTIVEDIISAVGITQNSAGGFIFEPGKIWIFFDQALPDSNYIVFCTTSVLSMAWVESVDRFPDMFIITVKDTESGNFVTPSEVGFEVKRMI